MSVGGLAPFELGYGDEGEGFESVADWRCAHEAFFERAIGDETPIVAQRFRVLQRL